MQPRWDTCNVVLTGVVLHLSAFGKYPYQQLWKTLLLFCWLRKCRIAHHLCHRGSCFIYSRQKKSPCLKCAKSWRLHIQRRYATAHIFAVENIMITKPCVREWGLSDFFPPRFARNYLKYNLLTRDVSKLIPDSLAAGASKA